MSELTEFLLARIAEDEAAARAAIDPECPGMHWHWVTYQTDIPVLPGEAVEALEHQPISLRTVEEYPTTAGNLPAFILNSVDEIASAGVADHIARHDPARILAECEAKRAIVGTHRSQSDSEVLAFCDGCGDSTPCPTIRALAVVYANHEDYRQAWVL